MAATPKSVVRSISKAQETRDAAAPLETIKVADNRKVKAAKPDVTSLPGMVRYAFSPQNRLSVWLGIPMAAGLPIAAFWFSHVELPADFAAATISWLDWCFIVGKILAVLGILVFSALTVYQWGYRAFRDNRKAVGYTVGVELVMLISDTPWLAITMCTVLVGINLIGTVVNIALGQKTESP